MAIRISEAGYWSGLAAALATGTYGLVQVLQVAGLLRFPTDEILIYGSSLCIVVPFILEMVAFHHLSIGDARYWTHAALLFSVVYAVTPLIAVVYFAPTFSNTLLFLGFPWAVTAPLFMWRLARLLRGRTASRSESSV